MPEKSFSEKCQKCPDHNSVCYGCLNQVNTFATIRDFIVKMEDQWLQHKFELAVKDVLEYKKTHCTGSSPRQSQGGFDGAPKHRGGVADL